MSSMFNRNGDFSLVFCTNAASGPWDNLASLCDKSQKHLYLLVGRVSLLLTKWAIASDWFESS